MAGDTARRLQRGLTDLEEEYVCACRLAGFDKTFEVKKGS